MKVFTVYKHESKGYEAVKVGFSWPALIFNFWWMLSKGFLFLVIFYVAAYILSIRNYDVDMNTPFNSNDFFYSIVALILFLYPGFYGNSWLNKKYIVEGYTELKAIPATSKESAIALAKNDQLEKQASIDTQDEIEESLEITHELAYKAAYDEIRNYENEDDKKLKIDSIGNPTLWAKAFAQSDGDENRQKVIYVKLRAQELDLEYEYELEWENKTQKDKSSFLYICIFLVIVVLIVLLMQ